MKRSVAVLGPTPQFVRWSINHPCALRLGGDTESPEATFRQLRGVREFSVAADQGRVFETFSIHPDSTSKSPELALGFGEGEVLEAFGGRDAIDAACNRCIANTNAIDDSNALWAGCYGWLAADGSSLGGLSDAGKNSPTADAPLLPAGKDLLVREIDFAIKMLNLQPLVDANFSVASPAWFGFWQQPTLSVPQLLLLEKVLSAALRRHETAGAPQFVDDLLRFIDALTLCHRHSVPLNVELVPRGFSDGNTWTLFAHCQRCRYSVGSPEESWTACPACGQASPPSGQRKLKVLGLRPYVNLSRVMGREGAADFLQRYEQSQAEARPTRGRLDS